jgi:mannose-6-phosphate isomerase-like protein (cupin superfamily)
VGAALTSWLERGRNRSDAAAWSRLLLVDQTGSQAIASTWQALSGSLESVTAAVVHGPGEGERHGAGGNSAVIIKASGDETDGSFFLSETTIDPGFPGPPPHRHERLHDMFYVLDGDLTMRLGDETHQIKPGRSYVYRQA